MKTGVLLIQLGTPDSPSNKDVRKYLTEFLNDKYVFDIPWLKRWLLVNLIIVPFRVPNSAKLYKEVWSEEGSPLLKNTLDLKKKLQDSLGKSYQVAMGMRYQNPTLKSALKELYDAEVSKIVAIPLYPQYATSTTKSTIEKINSLIGKMDNFPKINFIERFFDHPLFIDSWIKRAEQYNKEDYDHVIFSFHGLPERQIKKLDNSNSHCLEKEDCCTINCEWNTHCYKHHCYETAKTIASRIGLTEKDYTICFQSRLGRDPWIQPYSDKVIEEKAKQGMKNLLVFSPAFVADCLETLYEITVEYGEIFTKFGGDKVQLVESLNSSPPWVEALQELVKQHEAN
jgi:ferrochelatase